MLTTFARLFNVMFIAAYIVITVSPLCFGTFLLLAFYIYIYVFVCRRSIYREYSGISSGSLAVSYGNNLHEM